MQQRKVSRNVNEGMFRRFSRDLGERDSGPWLQTYTVTLCNTEHLLAHTSSQMHRRCMKESVRNFAIVWAWKIETRSATQSNTLQHTATHCNTLLQRTATHWKNLSETSQLTGLGRERLTLQHTATHCNTLQHTATHCNTLQHTATHCNTLQHTATYYNTLQHTAWRYVSEIQAWFGRERLCSTLQRRKTNRHIQIRKHPIPTLLGKHTQ